MKKPKGRSENFSFSQVRFMYTTNRTWRKIATAALIALCLLIALLIAILIWYFVFRIPDDGVQRDASDTSTAIYDPTQTTGATTDGIDYVNKGCFPPFATVRTPEGEKRMDQLRLGDRILDLKSDGQCCRWTSIYAFSFESDQKRIFVRLVIENKQILVLTPNHLIFRSIDQKNFEDIEASNLEIGDWIFLKNMTAGKVIEIQSIMAKGAYSPFTYSGTMLVDDVWISCFAGRYLDGKIGHEFIQRYVMAPLRFLANLCDLITKSSRIRDLILKPTNDHLWYIRLLKSMHVHVDYLFGKSSL
jgi:hypothetical protein